MTLPSTRSSCMVVTVGQQRDHAVEYDPPAKKTEPHAIQHLSEMATMLRIRTGTPAKNYIVVSDGAEDEDEPLLNLGGEFTVSDLKDDTHISKLPEILSKQQALREKMCRMYWTMKHDEPISFLEFMESSNEPAMKELREKTKLLVIIHIRSYDSLSADMPWHTALRALVINGTYYMTSVMVVLHGYWTLPELFRQNGNLSDAVVIPHCLRETGTHDDIEAEKEYYFVNVDRQLEQWAFQVDPTGRTEGLSCTDGKFFHLDLRSVKNYTDSKKEVSADCQLTADETDPDLSVESLRTAMTQTIGNQGTGGLLMPVQ